MSKYTKYDKRRNTKLTRIRMTAFNRLKHLARETGFDVVDLLDQAVDVLLRECRIMPGEQAIAVEVQASAIATKLGVILQIKPGGSALVAKSSGSTIIAMPGSRTITIAPKKAQKGDQNG